jgi:hypothetical protein
LSALHLAVDHEIAGRYRARSHVAGAPVGERWRVSDDQGPDGLLTLLTPPRAGKDPDALRAYLAALRTFGHPHAVPVTDAGVHRDEAFVVTEVPAGVALRAWLGDLKAEGRRVSLRDARAIIEQVIQCLATAHRHDEPLAHGASLARGITLGDPMPWPWLSVLVLIAYGAAGVTLAAWLTKRRLMK